MLIDSSNMQPSVNVYPNGGMGGYNNGANDIFGGNGGIFWIIILFFFAIFGGWGNNGYAAGNGGAQFVPYMMGNTTQSDIRSGFDQAAVMGGLNGIESAISNGFSNAEVSRCNQQANILATMNNNQNANIASMNSLAMALQNCCCENRAATADLKYTVATEACADRAAVGDALQAVSAQNNANTQRILDQMCQDKIDAKNERIAELERQLAFAQTSELVNGTRSAIIANNDLQTAALEQYLAPVPRPAYIVQNPSCCNQNFNNCGCRSCG